MRRSLARDFAAVADLAVEVRVAIGEREPDDPGPWTTLRIPEGAGIGRLVELAAGNDSTVLIAPETTGLLARLTRALERAGAVSLGCRAEGIELTADKLRLMEWFQASRVPTPESRLIRAGQGIPQDGRFPAVLKPVHGAGSLDTFFLSDPRTAKGPERASDDFLIQPFQPGIPMSASFLVDLDGTAWLIGTGRQSIAIREGRFEYRGGSVPEHCPEALPVLRRAVECVPGLGGFVGVDFVWNPEDRSAVVLEINPRVTTSHVGLSRLLPPGRLARAWLAARGLAGASRDILAGLADEVASRPAVRFDAEGHVRPGGPE
ncbi:MAG: ATP-grasp domain-containing protein [Isosphaeraceae bacterium]